MNQIFGGFIWRTDAKAETPVLWPPYAKSWLTAEDFDAGRDCGQEKKGTTEDEMAGWHHQLDGHEFEWTLGVGDGQGPLACCHSWGRKELDTTERLNWIELKGFPVAQTGKNLSAVQETWVWSPAQEDPLEKGMAIPSSILACKIPWTEEPGGLQAMGSQKIWHTRNWISLLYTGN